MEINPRYSKGKRVVVMRKLFPRWRTVSILTKERSNRNSCIMIKYGHVTNAMGMQKEWHIAFIVDYSVRMSSVIWWCHHYLPEQRYRIPSSRYFPPQFSPKNWAVISHLIHFRFPLLSRDIDTYGMNALDGDHRINGQESGSTFASERVRRSTFIINNQNPVQWFSS